MVLAAAPAALATPITSFANIPHSAISPGGVDMSTGEIIVVCRPDLVLEGPIPFGFGRYYASMLAREGLATGRMGPNWLGTFDWKVNVSGTTADVITNRGQDIKFQQPPAGGPFTLVSPLDQAFTLTFTGGIYRFTDPVERLVYMFTGSLRQLTQIADEHGNSITLTYSAGGQVTQATDGLGHALSFTYDPFAGMLSSITDGTRGVSYSYTGGTLTGFTDAAGHVWTYSYLSPSPFAALLTGSGEPAGNTPVQNAYDAQGRVVTQTDAVGGVAHYAWDAPGGNVFTDPLARSWTYLHDAQSRLTSLTDPNSQLWSRAYDASGRLTNETRPLGDVTSYSYDGTSGYPASVGFADGSVKHWTYGSHSMAGGTFFDLASIQFPDLTTELFTRDAAGNATDITDPGGLHWLSTYNSRGQVLTTTNPAGGVTQIAYGSGGRPSSETDPAGNITRYTYDGLNRLITLAPDDTSSRSWSYDALDRLTSATDERGKISSYAYDANGRLTGATNPLGQATHYGYDGLDRVIQVTDAAGNPTAFAYDACGNLMSTTDGTSRTTNYSYSVWGDFAGLSDPAGGGWSYPHDANRRVTQAQDPLGHSSLFSYDAVDRLTHLTDPVGTGFDYGYDAMDRLHTVNGPLGLSRTFNYDARGLLISTLNGTSEYDYARTSLGALSQFTDPNRHASPFSYDNAGRLTGAADPLGRLSSYSYDSRNRLIHATLPVNAASLSYDGANRLVGVAITDGTTLGFGYDDANRQISGNGASFAYDAAGRMTSSNGLSFTYDAAGRLTSEAYSPAQVVTYAYDSRGRLSQVTDWLGGITTFNYDISGNYTGTTRPNGTHGTYSYDAAGNLVNATEIGPGPSQLSSLTITRDALEQPTAVERTAPLMPGGQTPGTTNLTYDAASQVTGLTWDAMGRLLGDGSRTLVWDGASRLKSYSMPGESQSFTYDGFSRPISHTQGATTEQYQWNYANGFPTLDVVMNGGTPVRYFIHTPSGLLLESIEFTGGVRHFYHYDENGNTSFLTDDAGAVIEKYAYGPNGEVHAQGSITNNLFTLGGAMDMMLMETSGLYFFFRHTDGHHELSGSGIYDSKYGRVVSGGAIASGSGGMNASLNSGLNSPLNSGLNSPLNSAQNSAQNSPMNSPQNSPFKNPMNDGMPDNGLPDNGMPDNGIPDNGIPDNGIPDNGIPSNGTPFNGVALIGVLHRGFVGTGYHTEAYSSGGHSSATMYIEDVTGDTKDKQYLNNKPFEIKDFSFGVENPTSIGSATGGAGSGKASFHEFTITRTVDSASPYFFKNCASGAHYKTVTIQMRKAGGDKSGKSQVYLQYTFSTVFITGIHWTGPGDEGPEEEITFVFGQMKIDYAPQQPGGSNGVIKAPGLVFLPGHGSLGESNVAALKPTGSSTGCLWCPH